MKRSSKQNRNLAVFTAIATMSVFALGGCELLVDFDRTLIDGGTLGDVDGSGFDGSLVDSSNEAAVGDSGSDSSTITDGDAAVTEPDADADIDADM